MLFMRPYREGDSFPEINPDPKNGLYFIALDGEKLIGFGRWKMTLDGIRIEEIEDGGDPEVFDGLLRGILNMAMEQGIDRAAFSGKIRPDRLATSMVPVDKENGLKSISYFLENYKKCKMFLKRLCFISRRCII